MDFQLLETMLYYGHNIYLKNYHIQRLYHSAKNLRFNYKSYQNILNIFNKLHLELNHKYQNNIKYCLRLLFYKNGEITYTVQPINNMPLYGLNNNKLNLVLSQKCIEYNDSNKEFWINKTTMRIYHDNLYQGTKENSNIELGDIILYDKYGYITEASRANIAILDKNNQFITPPVLHGLLAGTMRQYLLYNNLISCRSIKIEELKDSKSILWFNSLRGIYRAKLIV